MAARLLSRLLILAVAAGILCNPGPGRACGAYISRAMEEYTVHPDFPLAEFAQGHIGIIKPTFARSYLLVAYRYFSGEPLDLEQQKALNALWKERLNIGPEGVRDYGPKPNAFTRTKQAWEDTRERVGAVNPGPSIVDYSELGAVSYSDYANCLQDSLRNSASALSDRIQRFGANSSQIKEWVEAQDAVYSNCGGKLAIPEPPKADYPAVLKADRLYQIAAAYFYAGKFDEAARAFRAIAEDPISPWNTIAPYLVARCFVRKATVGAGPGQVDAATLEQAEAQLNGVLSDKRLDGIHPAASRLMNFVRFRLRPDDRLAELARAVTGKAYEPLFKQEVWDFTLLMDTYERDDFNDIAEAPKKSDLADWIFAFQSKGTLDYCLDKWARTKSTPWLIASLSKCNIGNPRAPELLAAAKKIDPGAAAYPEATFQAARLLMQLGRNAEARSLLDAALLRRSTLPQSTVNQLFSERMCLAASLDEFLKYAPRTAAIISEDDSQEIPNASEGAPDANAQSKEPYLDSDAIYILNAGLPLTLLEKAADSLPEPMNSEVAVAVWVRAAVLGNMTIARRIAPVVKRDFPQLNPLIDSYLSADSRDERLFAAVFLILKNPGAEPFVNSGIGRRKDSITDIDNYRGNWWCGYSAEAWRDRRSYATGDPMPPGTDSKGVPIRVPDFLSPADRKARDAEWKELSAIPTAPNYLAIQVIDWVHKRPNDPRLPEALHLVVRAARFGCDDTKTRVYAKRAFDLLHRRYPKTSWAKETKYWYAN